MTHHNKKMINLYIIIIIIIIQIFCKCLNFISINKHTKKLSLSVYPYIHNLSTSNILNHL